MTTSETANLWTETITASCQECGAEVSGEFLVSSDLARHDAIGLHARRAIPPCRRRADRRNRRPRRRGVVVSEESIRPTTQRDLS